MMIGSEVRSKMQRLKLELLALGVRPKVMLQESHGSIGYS